MPTKRKANNAIKTAANADPELKVCPFCGKHPKTEYSELSKQWYVMCLNPDCNCKPVVCVKGTFEEAAKIWNNRISDGTAKLADIAELIQKIESLREELKEMKDELEEIKKTYHIITVPSDPPRDIEWTEPTMPYVDPSWTTPKIPGWPHRNPDGSPAITCSSKNTKE